MLLQSLYLIVWLIHNQVSCASSSNLIAKQSYLIKTGFTNIVWDYIESVDLSKQNVSSSCKSTLSHVIGSINQGATWPLQLLDASGRAPVDFTGLGFVALGNYDECLRLDWIDYDGSNKVGKYCLANLLPDDKVNLQADIYTRHKIVEPEISLNFQIGFCLPSSCSTDDLNIILSNALKSFSWDLIDIKDCQVKTTFLEKLTASSVKQKIAFVCVAILIFTVLVSTFLDFNTKMINPDKHCDQISWFKNFSMITSYNQMVEPNRTSDRMIELTQYAMILRTIGLILHLIGWPIFIKMYSLFAGASNYMLYKSSPLALIFNQDWMNESIFVYAGLIRSLVLWRCIGPKTTLRRIFIDVSVTLISLSILVTITMFIHINLNLFISGPFNVMDRQTIACERSFWQVIFLHNNWIDNLDDSCLLQFWSISVEGQLLILMVILVYLYKRYPKIGLTMNLAVIVGSLLYIGFVYYHNEYPIFGLIQGIGNFRYMETYLVIIEFANSMHLWIYLTTVLWTYLIMNNYDSVIYKVRFLRTIGGNLKMLGILLTIGPLFHVLASRLHESRLTDAIFVVLYRVLILIFYSYVAFNIGDGMRRYFSYENKKEAKVSEANNNGNSSNSMTPGKMKFYHITSTILRSAYYFHVTIITSTIENLRQPVLTTRDLIAFTCIQIFFCLLGGIVLHLFVIGPLRNVVLSLRKVKSSQDLKKIN